MPKSEIARRLAEILDSGEDREVRARHAAQAIREARDYRWVGIYDVGDNEVELIGHTGPNAPVFVRFENTRGLTGEAVRTRDTVVSDDVAKDPRYLTAFESTGSEIVVPVLAAEIGTVMGTLDVESDRIGAFGDDDRDFLEACAMALMPLFE